MNENKPDAVKAIGPEKCYVHNGSIVGRQSGKKNLIGASLIRDGHILLPFDSRHGVSDVEVPQEVDDRGRLASEEALIEKDWLVTSCNCPRIRAGATTEHPPVGMRHRSRLQSTDNVSSPRHEFTQLDVVNNDNSAIIPCRDICPSSVHRIEDDIEIDFGYKPVYTTHLNQEAVAKLHVCLRYNKVIAQIKRLQSPGLNGEITFKHGVDPAEEINNTNKRANKEAKTSLFRKPVLAQRNKDNAARRVHTKDLDKDIVKEEEKQPNIVRKVVLSLGFGEPSLFVRSNGLGSFQVSDSLREEEELKTPGQLGHWILSNDGFTYRYGKGLNMNPLPDLIIDREIRSFEYMDYAGNKVTKDKTRHVVFLPFLKLLQKVWQSPEYGLSRETAIRNYGQKAFAESCSTVGGLYYEELQRLFESTIKYFIFLWIAKCHKVDLFGNKNPLVNDHNVFKTAWYNNYEIEQTGTYIKMNVTPRHLPREFGKYKFKTKPNIQIQLNRIDPSGKRVSISTDEDTILEDLVGFSYNPKYSVAGLELSRNYVSVGLDVVPCCWDRSDTSDTRSYLDVSQNAY